MQCDAIIKLLHEEPQGVVQDPAVAAHLLGCMACRAAHEELSVLRRSLRQLEPPELPQGFELALRRRLLAEAPALQAAPAKSGSPRWRAARYMALAASLLLALGAVFWQLQPGPTATPSHFSLALQVQAATDYPAAVFQLTLPDGMKLGGGLASELGQGRIISWRSKLAQGTSSIALPLEGALEGEVVVQARLTVAGQSYTARTRILARQAAGGSPVQPPQLAWVLPADREQPQEVRE